MREDQRRPGDPSGPSPIGPPDAEELCGQAYPDRAEAMAVARWLRAAGWVVVEVHGVGPRPDGTTVVASVYHPATYESPGDLTVSGPSTAG